MRFSLIEKKYRVWAVCYRETGRKPKQAPSTTVMEHAHREGTHSHPGYPQKLYTSPKRGFIEVDHRRHCHHPVSTPTSAKKQPEDLAWSGNVELKPAYAKQVGSSRSNRQLRLWWGAPERRCARPAPKKSSSLDRPSKVIVHCPKEVARRNIAAPTSHQERTNQKILGHAGTMPTTEVLPLPNHRSSMPSWPHPYHFFRNTR